MNKVGLSEAAEALRDFFGQKLDADRENGIDRMVDALVERFQLSKHDARKILDELIAAGSVHFVPGGPTPGVATPLPVSGDRLATAVQRAERRGLRYRLVRTIAEKGAPVVEIYRRDGYAYSLH